jgi:ectoine hydroxylase-related dioxygenase (phytanoyl-CoA dioxygenase family)
MTQAIDRHADELRTQGYTIIPNVLDASEIERARGELSRIWEAEREVGAARGWHNKSWVVSYMLPLKSEYFRALPMNPKVVPFMRAVLGHDCILSSLNGLMMVPKGETQRLHLDQSQTVPGLVININGTYALDDFTMANGCTRVVPGSQNRDPGMPIDPERDEKLAIHLEAPAGSLIAFNGGIVHAGSANTTEGLRRCVHSYYSRPWVRSQWDFARSFPESIKAGMSEEARKLYGFYAHEQVYEPATHEVRRA